MFYKGFVKRALDIFLSTLGIVVLIPIWVFLAVAIKLDDAGPVFFKQKRIAKNKNGEIQYFYILKYRSMKTTTPKDMPTHLLQNPEQYITRVGKILRKTSLDELPQIFNVFLGQMSLIGPRPALYNQEDLYFERAKHGANDVTPGITGWAQINGRFRLKQGWTANMQGFSPQAALRRLLLIAACFLERFYRCSNTRAWWKAARANWPTKKNKKKRR